MAQESAKPGVRQHRVDLAIRVELKYPDRDTFVERFAANVSRTGLFVRARDPAAVGSRVRFEYKLADGTRLLRGVGIVRWARSASMASDPDKPAGMGIEFVDLDAESEELVGRIVARFGDGERAPRRAAATARPAEAVDPAARPRTTARPLDRDEETALDTLLDGLGDALPPRAPPGAGARAATTAAPPVEPSPSDAAPAGAAADTQAPPSPAATSSSPPPADAAGAAIVVARDLGGELGGDDASSTAMGPGGAGLAPEGGLPRLLASTGDELREPPDPVSPTTPDALAGLTDADVELVADLSASAWRAALVPKGQPFAGVGDTVQPTAGEGEAAHALPSPLDWLIAPWPAPRARVVARRLGLELVDDDSGFPAVRWQGLTLSSAALIQTGLEKLLSAVASRVRPRQARIVLPASTSDAAKRLVLRRFAGLGVARCVVTPAAAAVLARAREDAPAAPALVIELLRLQARMMLFGEGGEMLAGGACLEAGYDRVDEAVVASLATLAGIGAHPPGSGAALLAATRVARRAAPAGPWLLAWGGEEHAVASDAVARVARDGYEALALEVDELLRAQDLDPADVRIVVAAEEPSWPGLADTFAEVLGTRPTELAPDPWLRLRGLSAT